MSQGYGDLRSQRCYGTQGDKRGKKGKNRMGKLKDGAAS